MPPDRAPRRALVGPSSGRGSGRAVAAVVLDAAAGGQAAAVLHEEAPRAGELVLLLGQDADGQLLVGQVGAGQLEALVEVGLVVFRDRIILLSTNWLVNPGLPIPAAARQVHGITDAMVADSPHFAVVFDRFRGLVGSSVLLAHNAHFDVRFVSRELRRNSLPAPENIVLDTLRLARKWFPRQPSHSLQALRGHLGIPDEGLHRALADARCVCALFLAGAEGLPPGADLSGLVDDAGGALRFAGSEQTEAADEQ